MPSPSALSRKVALDLAVEHQLFLRTHQCHHQSIPSAASDNLCSSHCFYGDMALEKRKRATESDNVRPEKKSRPSKPTSKLIVPREEPAFQRGGASILTPLEKKQIQVQATRDALFEQNTGQKARNAEFEDDENENDVDIDGGRKPAKPKANTKAKRKGPKGVEKEDTSGLRIEGLSYKVFITRNPLGTP